MYGAEIWQISTREINNILSTEMDVLRRSARKSTMERIKNEHIKVIMGVNEKPDIIDIIERKFRSRSVVKQKGMVFGFRKTATAVTRPER
jgi:hypothetical protein